VAAWPRAARWSSGTTAACCGRLEAPAPGPDSPHGYWPDFSGARKDAASHGQLLFDYRPRFWFRVWRRLHGRSRVTLWEDGTLRRDSSFHTKQVNLNGCRDFRIEAEGELTFEHGDRVFSASTAIRLRDRAGKLAR
jgi:hypothetical protein